MFLRARLKSAYNYVFSMDGVVMSVLADVIPFGYFMCQALPDKSSAVYQDFYLAQIKAEPRCQSSYEIWDKRFSLSDFTCGTGADIEAYKQKFHYFAKAASDTWGRNWAAENWFKYLVLPLGVGFLMVAAYGFLNPSEKLIQDERLRAAESKPTKKFKTISTQTDFPFFSPARMEDLAHLPLPPAYNEEDDKKNSEIRVRR